MDISSLWDFDDPAASEARFRAAAEDATGDERSVLLTQVVRALGLQSEFGEGHAILDALPPGAPEVQVRAALERGRLFRSAGDPGAALPRFRSAAALAAKHADLEGRELDALHMIPLCFEGDEQVAATAAAVEHTRYAATPGGRRWLASLLDNLGMAHSELGEWDAALVAFKEALAERRKQGDESDVFVARWMVAWAMRNLGRTDEAKAEQLSLKADLTAAGKTDQYVEEELALLG